MLCERGALESSVGSNLLIALERHHLSDNIPWPTESPRKAVIVTTLIPPISKHEDRVMKVMHHLSKVRIMKDPRWRQHLVALEMVCQHTMSMMLKISIPPRTRSVLLQIKMVFPPNPSKAAKQFQSSFPSNLLSQVRNLHFSCNISRRSRNLCSQKDRMICLWLDCNLLSLRNLRGIPTATEMICQKSTYKIPFRAFVTNWKTFKM